jgi:hypothetical protein
MITDINNAGASATGQSVVPIMFDSVSAGTFGDGLYKFNHVPGGAPSSTWTATSPS